MADDKLPWAKWFWGDWLSALDLRQCSPAARGVWMDMLCVCAQSQPPGYLKVAGQALDNAGIAKLCGITVEEAVRLVGELEMHHVFSRTRDQIIYSRRLVRQEARRERLRENGSKGGKASKRGRKGIFSTTEQSQEQATERATEQRPEQRQEQAPEPQRLEARGQRLESTTARASQVAARAPAKVDEEDVAWQRLVHDLNELWERIGNPFPMTPTLHIETWREKGYDRQMILEVVRKKIQRDTRKLTWFDGALEDAHRERLAARARNKATAYVTEAEPLNGWDKAVGTYKTSGAWLTAWGPPPDQPSCKAPREILTRHYPDRYPPLHQGGNA